MEVYGRCDPCLHEDPGLDDGGANRPRSPRNGKQPPTVQRTCDDTSAGPHEDPLTASRAALREGDGTRSRGLISPCRRMCSTAPVVLPFYLRVSPESTSAVSKPVPAGKRPHVRTPGGLPEELRPTQVQSGSAADWRPPKSGDQEDDGRLPSGTDPEKELNGQWCCAMATYGLHQSWWSLVTRTEWEPPTLRAALWVSTRPAWWPPRWPAASPATNVTDSLLTSLQSKTS